MNSGTTERYTLTIIMLNRSKSLIIISYYTCNNGDNCIIIIACLHQARREETVKKRCSMVCSPKIFTSLR